MCFTVRCSEAVSTADDWAAWRTMEAACDRGAALSLGISNVALEQLQRLCDEARIGPSFVQNRCYASQGWDRGIRQYCAANQIVYQGFSLLTANRDVLAHAELAQIAARRGRTASQIVFRFALDVGMLPLTGTSSAEHMHTTWTYLIFGSTLMRSIESRTCSVERNH